ncbi:MAG: molybdopterin-dependent oxidoreductase [Thermoproteota archaeon]|nr:molybdopterin-dependent oxidoreductase [Thermoproteota archaeon]
MKNKNARNLVLGLIAGSVALLVAAAFRIFAGGLFIPELASQTLFSLTPGEVESFSVETFGSLAKYTAFTTAIIVNLVIYGGLAILLHKTYVRLSNKSVIVNLIQLSFIPYLVMVAISAFLLQLNELLTGSSEIQYVLLFLLLPSVGYGGTLSYLFQRRRGTAAKRIAASKASTPETQEQEGGGEEEGRKKNPELSTTGSRVRRITRREFITMAAATVVVAIFVFWARSFPFHSKSSMPTSRSNVPLPPTSTNIPAGSIFAEEALAPLVASELTPNDKFYRIDTNLIVPSVDANTWRLNVRGLVRNGPLQFTYDELKGMPSTSEYATLECISDKIDGDLISTAYWKGVPLKTILEQAQVLPGAIYIVFRCSDGYDVGIPLDRGLMEGTILAYEMNGVPLPAEHGFPVRAIVPGLYGMMNAKWITDIELVDTVYEGFWQRRGWANNAKYQTHSKIAFPGNALRNRIEELSIDALTVGSKSPIAGVAFAGDRGISKVEVSMDGGNTWHNASIKDPLSSNSWVLWALDWIPQNKGKYNIVVRATDKTGNVQTAEIRDNYPNGATGYHSVEETVA